MEVLTLRHTLIAITCLLLFTACTKEKVEEELEINGYVKVEGTCHENHVDKAVNYEGELISSRFKNKIEQPYRVVGSVHLTKEMQDYQMRNITAGNLFKYSAPFNIEFRDVNQEEFSKDEMTIQGISSYYDDDREAYETTCTLKVIERLDYHPSFIEQGEIAK